MPAAENPTTGPRRPGRRIRIALGRRAPMAGPLSRAFRQLVARAAVGAAAGVALGAAALTIDAAVGWSLPFPPDRVRDLLITLTGASLTIAVFALWMRSIVVSLVARVFHARTLASFLDDRFQQAMAGWMVAAFSVLTTVAVASPGTDEGGAPPVASVLALVTVVAALLGILLAVRQAAARLDTSDLVHQLADRGFRILEETEGLADDPAPEAAHEPVRSVDAGELGWVRRIDRHELVGALPEATTAALHVTAGSFVAPGQTVLTVDRQVGEAVADALRDAIEIGRTRDPESDLGSSIEELTDIAKHAAGAGNDAGTAREALRYLEALLGRLIDRGLPTGHLRAGSRALVAVARTEVADHVGWAAERLRSTATQDPGAARLIDAMLDRLAERAERAGDGASRDALRADGEPRPGTA